MKKGAEYSIPGIRDRLHPYKIFNDTSIDTYVKKGFDFISSPIVVAGP